MLETNRFTDLQPFRYWCQKVLPAVYDDSLSYYELLCKVSENLNEVIANSNVQNEAIKELQDLMAEFLAGDVSPYVEAKIDEWFVENQPAIVAELESLETSIANINKLNDQQHLMKIQERFETNGDSRFLLEMTESIEPFNTETSDQYLPFITFYNGTQQMNLNGDFKVLETISNVSDSRYLFHSYLRPSQNWTIHDCLEYVDADGKLGTASMVIEPDGDMRFFSPDGRTLVSGMLVHIDQGAFTTASYHKDFDFPVITQNDILLANAWIQNRQGSFDYSNNLSLKNNADDSGSTDCSGLIFNAFYYGATKVVPNFADAQAGFGKVIAFAKPGEELDFTDAIMGDIVFYITPSMETAHHCTWFDGVNLWEQDTTYTGGQSKGPQIVAGGTTTNENYLKTNNFRFIVRWKDHYADTYNWDDLIQGE